MQKKISVIIPVYNVEAYLKECLDSIVSQELHDIEIICVNDGSTDGSLSILEKYAADDKRIIIIDQKNQGLSGARNNGLKKAQGEYILFSDSDDYLLTSNTLSLLYTTASMQDLDILSFDFTIVGEQEKAHHVKRKIGILSNGKHFLQNGDSVVMAWCKLYKRAYLESIYFFYNETIIHEDDEAHPRLYVNASRVSHIDMLLYAYRQRANSIMTQKISLKHFSSLATIIATYETLLQKEPDSGFRKYLKKQIAFYVIRYHFLLQNTTNLTEAADTYKSIIKNLSLSKLELLLINNEIAFMESQANLEHKLSHPLVYLLRKFRKIVF
ncbi:MAG: glycosyltransferase [Sulfuricurvum sp.]|uniref:glycosyltransferase n=1 Tax=Sulfuricurvum sp. TaxID=2025608 RepID=UPI00262CB34F|nr:glycosyltransferase [Sulfuricurvum sp.]MDD5159200.1 glycosyltransferase [Sulfuricurvum sp.]